jgi:hypothetical protein
VSAGIAWQLGVISGLRDAGTDLTAYVAIGTSARGGGGDRAMTGLTRRTR